MTWDWSPDGKKMIGMIPLGEFAIAVYSLETGKFERIVEDITAVPSWLPDSRRFLFEKDNKIYIADSETKRTKEIHSRAPERIRSPFISGDGKLLYYTAHSSESDIWLLDVTQNP